MVDNCVVVGRSLTTTNTVLNSAYLGLTLEITNSTVFDVPGPCAEGAAFPFLKVIDNYYAECHSLLYLDLNFHLRLYTQMYCH